VILLNLRREGLCSMEMLSGGACLLR